VSNVTSFNYTFRNEPARNISAECGIRFDGHSSVMEVPGGGTGTCNKVQAFKSWQNALYVRGKIGDREFGNGAI
jgi:hypothetical protein